MNESFPNTPQEEPREDNVEKEQNMEVALVMQLIEQAESVLEKEGRETAKLLTPAVYGKIMTLNKRDASDYSTQWMWNPDGSLTEGEFAELNLRRKLLSNAIGIMTASGKVRHDLNVI